MVSNMSSMNCRTSSSTTLTSSLRLRRTGEPSRWIGNALMLWLAGGGAVADADDARALDDDGRGAALDGHPIVLHVLHLPDDAAARGDLVALLEAGENLVVLLPRRRLGADDEEVEHETDRTDL